jgi:predicted dehydrogenase
MVQKVGLIGCGNISDIYLTNAPRFRHFEIVACADLRSDAAEAKARAYGIAPLKPDALLADPGIDIVLNLTVPAAHAEIGLAALDAGKHVYTEKPLTTRLADGRRLIELAANRQLRVGSAPDTVLGAATQAARRLIDSGEIGQPILGVAAVLSHGMESWHPNPGFFFKAGGGPVLDMGPYYIASLVQLLGPVSSVVAEGRIGNATRTITAEGSPFRGQTITVETLTSVQAILGFSSGAQVTLLASWDVWANTMPHIEIHGTEGSLSLPDPNWFGGDVKLSRRGAEWTAVSSESATFGIRNYDTWAGPVANYRGLGLADMSRAIEAGEPHRMSGELGLHVLEVMEAMLEGAVERTGKTLTASLARPDALGPADAEELLRP